MQALELRLAGIAPGDEYSFTYPEAPGRYEGVEERFPGLPLLIVDARQRVVCGHDYLRLLIRRGSTRARALRLELSLAEGLLLNLNLLERLFGLNLCEKLMFARKIWPLLPAAEVQRRAGLGFPLSEELRRRLDVLLAPPFCDVLAAGRLGLRTALKLAGQESGDREAQLGVFAACGFSESQQWQMARALEEIAFREKKTVARVLAARGLLPLLAGEMPQQRFLAALGERRYPALSRMEREWRSWEKRATAKRRAALAHAPLFASEEVRITVTVKDRAAAAALLRRLDKG